MTLLIYTHKSKLFGKKMKKMLLASMMLMVATSYLAAEWDQSLSRWESDCGDGMASGCSMQGVCMKRATM